MEVLNGEAEEVLYNGDEVLKTTSTLVLLSVGVDELEVRPLAMEMAKILMAIVGRLHGYKVVAYPLKRSCS